MGVPVDDVSVILPAAIQSVLSGDRGVGSLVSVHEHGVTGDTKRSSDELYTGFIKSGQDSEIQRTQARQAGCVVGNVLLRSVIVIALHHEHSTGSTGSLSQGCQHIGWLVGRLLKLTRVFASGSLDPAPDPR